MSKFPWGHVIDILKYDFDGNTIDVTKYIDKDGNTLYHVEELHESFFNMDAMLISWIAWRRLGLNQRALVGGICRALEIGIDTK